MKGITNRIEGALNEQILLEGESSQYYLSMASWAENQGYSGTAEFLYLQADEEREHMLKLIKYVNERGGVAVIPNISKP
ncbi:ferritin, partial [archaeon]|nr:ferritin [archaeon]